MNNLSEAVSEYCASQHFLFLDSTIKEHAEPVLLSFCSDLDAEMSATAIGAALKKMARLDVPLQVRKRVPDLLRAFFEYLNASGKLPTAKHCADCVSQSEKQYMGSFRKDGSVRGETFKKNYTDVGRNEPCPCGSGKKFKKCCSKLFT